MELYYDRLSELPLFDQIDASELPPMLKCIDASVHTYEAGSYVILDGSQMDRLGAVLSGMVHMVKEDAWGEKTILALIGPSQIFGETHILGEEGKSNVSFIAAARSELLFLSFRKLLYTCPKSCEHHQRLIENMISLIAHKNLQLMDKLEVTTKRSLRAKILTYLSQVSQKSESKYFTVPLGRIEMAEYLCADRSALTRELARMREDGLLDFSGNTFRLFHRTT